MLSKKNADGARRIEMRFSSLTFCVSEDSPQRVSISVCSSGVRLCALPAWIVTASEQIVFHQSAMLGSHLNRHSEYFRTYYGSIQVGGRFRPTLTPPHSRPRRPHRMGGRRPAPTALHGSPARPRCTGAPPGVRGEGSKRSGEDAEVGGVDVGLQQRSGG